jgi:hypothetical protein
MSIPLNNGYPLNLIYNTRNRIIHKLNTHNHETQAQCKIWSTFTYFSPVVHKITNLFKCTNINIAFRPTNTIFHRLQNYPHSTIVEYTVFNAILATDCMLASLADQFLPAIRNILDTSGLTTLILHMHSTS